MPGFSRHFLIAPVLATIALTGCTTSGEDVQTSFDMTSEQAFTLPDTVSILPLSVSDGTVALASAALPAGASPLTVAEEQQIAEANPEPVPAPRPSPKISAETQAALDKATVASLAEEKAAKPNLLEAAFSPSTYGLGETPRGKVDQLIVKYAEFYDIPVELVRSVVKRESNFQPDAYSRGHWGLMQIKHATARGMGYKGPAKGLLDPETNLKYAVRYLAGAYLVADGNQKRADRLYQRGYYYDAKRKGLLDETGLGRDRVRRKS